MRIQAQNLGKRFNREWIFRNLNLDLQTGNSYAVTGPNGSGKSTLIQVISGIMPYSEGSVSYSKNKMVVHPDDIYRSVSIATPYQELIEEFTLSEQIDFHLKFKSFQAGCSKEQLIVNLDLVNSQDKEIRFFSSGMKTRLKLGLAFYSDCPILLLDEPTANLDSKGIDWYQQEIRKNMAGKIVLICSNQKYEYEICQEIIDISIYKK